MFNNEILKEYERIIKSNNYHNITKIFCLYCVEESCKWLEIQDTTSQDEKFKIASVVYNFYLDTDIQISKISDIIVQHWNNYLNDENFNIFDYIESENY